MDGTTPTSTPEQVLRLLDAILIPEGWDQPHLLAYVASGAEELDYHDDLGPDALRLSVPASDLSIYLTCLGHCDAYQALLGRSAPAWAEAVVLVTEAWVAPWASGDSAPSPMAPSQHPDRMEMRLLTWVGRSGPVEALRRARNEEPKLTTPDAFQGRLVDALLRVMGRPVEPALPVDAYTARLAAGWFRSEVAHGEPLDELATVLRAQLEADAFASWKAVFERRRSKAETAGERTLTAWMGVGMLANFLVNLLPSVAEQLATLEHTAGAGAADALRAMLEAMDLDDGSRATYQQATSVPR